jgi:hypothetical protein
MANRRWFPTVMDVDKKELERFVGHSRESIRRSLSQLTEGGLIHLGATTGRGRIQVRICYEEFEATKPTRRAVRAQSERFRPVRAQIVREEIHSEAPGPLSSCAIPTDSEPTQVQDSRETPDCPERTTSVSEVGEDLREGSPCPKCRQHPLTIRFRTDAVSRTKQRFLACSGYSTGGCRGFTWNLGSTAYQPSQRVLSQALSGARHVPGRPALVRDVLAAANRGEEQASRPMNVVGPADLADLLEGMKYLPENLLLDALHEFVPELAARHRVEGSHRRSILRDVKARIASGSASI